MLRLLTTDPAAPRRLIVAALIVLLPVPYVLWGRAYAPFAKDLALHPEDYRDREAILVLNRVSQLGKGWAELGEPGGTVRVEVDPRFGLVKDEYVSVRVGSREGRYVVLDVSRHVTRRRKWAVSIPVLLAVAILCLVRVKVDLGRRSLALRPWRGEGGPA